MASLAHRLRLLRGQSRMDVLGTSKSLEVASSPSIIHRKSFLPELGWGEAADEECSGLLCNARSRLLF